MSNETKVAVMLAVVFVIWMLRNTEAGFIWKWVRTAFLVLFAVLMANYAKKEIKEWWNKD
jgi:hypothetical protein